MPASNSDMPDEKSLFTVPNWVIPSNLSRSNSSLPVTAKKINNTNNNQANMSSSSIKLLGRNRQNETEIIKRIQAVLNIHL